MTALQGMVAVDDLMTIECGTQKLQQTVGCY